MNRRKASDVRLDLHRRQRRSIPEVILGSGKTPGQLVRIARRMLAANELIVITRLAPEVFAGIARQLPALRYDALSRMAFHVPAARRTRRGLIVVVTGGTSDVPIAEEAAVTSEVLGSRVARLYDVGVAGVHRVLKYHRLLQRARAIVVAAGMEGALASVVAGLARCPVLAVPTSIGYGASFEGLSALLTMLNSCVPGIGVVNIDNGFGAGYLAHVINVQR
ncbi:MAG: nickel pincer cofactor biosynthesis protein LarB [Candidatus Omnitrophica bacterium]|nr:nickel pincer cofactor biosynthesis protein LarB [Candidatus Omnitrophota bacterium]